MNYIECIDMMQEVVLFGEKAIHNSPSFEIVDHEKNGDSAGTIGSKYKTPNARYI